MKKFQRNLQDSRVHILPDIFCKCDFWNILNTFSLKTQKTVFSTKKHFSSEWNGVSSKGENKSRPDGPFRLSTGEPPRGSPVWSGARWTFHSRARREFFAMHGRYVRLAMETSTRRPRKGYFARNIARARGEAVLN